MKNKPNPDILWKQNVKKILLTMKISFLLLVLTMLNAYATSIFSQNATMTVDMQNVTVREVVREIEKQGGISFLFNDNLQELNRRVSVSFTDQPIKDVLVSALGQADMMYEEIKDDFVVLISKPDHLNQQQFTVTGRVTDPDIDEPLPGVSIIEKGTLVGTATDSDGYYSITVSSGDAILVFSFVGYMSREVIIDNRTEINIALRPDLLELDEVIMIGYGTARRSDLTGSVSRLSSSDFETRPITNITEAMTGTVAGFYSRQGTLAAGGGSMEVRGPSSLAAETRPLIVLDGVIYPGNIGDINPSDIESIDILKDASSAAIFGARSASGIVVITTTKGRVSAPTINFSSKVGVSGLTNHMKPLSADDYLRVRGDLFYRLHGQERSEYYYTHPDELPTNVSREQWATLDGESPTDDYIRRYLSRLVVMPKEVENYVAGRTYDWYDRITQNGIRQDYDLRVSGGLDNLRYYLSTGYLRNEGVTLGDAFETFRSRVNLEADLYDFLTVGAYAQFANRNQGFERIPIGNAVRMSPWTYPYDDDGELVMWPNDDTILTNPYMYYYNRQRLLETQSLFGTLFGQVNLPLGFSFRVNYSNNLVWNQDHLFDPLNTPRGLSNAGYGYRTHHKRYEWMVDNILSWNRTIADIHRFDVTMLFNVEQNQSWYERYTNTNFEPNDVLGFHALDAGTNPSLNTNDEYVTGNALMARLNYVLMDKYMLTFSIRRDGYSAFGYENPHANFPSGALAWTISEEDFFNIDWFNHLRIRTSWGVAGNRDIGAYDAMARLGTTRYLYGSELAIGVFSSTMANRGLRWERTEAFNVGIDFGLFDARIGGNLEIYNSSTTDLLLRRSLPQIIGYESVMANLGKLENRGVELTLNTVNIQNPNIYWRSNFVFSLNRNKILSLYGDMRDVYDEDGNLIGQREADDISNEWFIGQSIERIWDYDVIGVWQLDEAAEAAIYGKEPGDMKLRDVNGDGRYVPEDDKVFQGYKTPQYRLGLRNNVTFLRNFNLSFFIRADLGWYGVNNLYQNDAQGGQWERINTYDVPYWTPDNPSNEWARLGSDMANPSFNVWRSRSFVRLQDITLSYNIPSETIKQVNIQSLRIYFNIWNALTFTGWDHYDPESGTNPMPQFFTFGVDLGL